MVNIKILDNDNEILLADNDEDIYNTESELSPQDENYGIEAESPPQDENYSVEAGSPPSDAVIEAVNTSNEMQELQKKVTELSAQMQTLRDNVQTNTKSTQIFGKVDAPIGYLSVAGVVLSLVIFILIAWLASRLRGLELSNENVDKNTNNNTEVIEGLNKTIQELKDDNAKLLKKIEALEEAAKKSNSAQTKKIPLAKTSATSLNNSAASTAPALLPSSRPVEKFDNYTNFIKEFNELSNQIGYDAVNATREFVHKYKVKKFFCKNFEARMNNPIPPPEFATDANGNYWAYEFADGVFAVVPKVDNYTDNIHFTQAMSEVFRSNFVDGGVYNKIYVRKPAIFKGEWTLSKKGSLELGN